MGSTKLEFPIPELGPIVPKFLGMGNIGGVSSLKWMKNMG